MTGISSQSKKPLVVSVNQDSGIGPGRAKGAAVHVDSMRIAFQSVGARCIGLDEPDDAQLMRALSSLLAEGPVDLIYERYALGKSAAAEFAAAHGIPLVLEVNAPLAEEQRRWRGSSDEADDARRDTITMSRACSIIAVSSEVGKYAIQRGARKDAVVVFPNGIDCKQFNMGARDTSLRKELVPDTAFVIGFHGRLRPWHGFGMLVDVSKELLARGRDIHLLVVGEGDFAELEHLPVDCRTRLGWTPHQEIPKYVAAFDALPLTYHADMPCYFSPLKLREAMACGVVPLVPELGDLPMAVQHGKTGFVYAAGDKTQLLAQLERLITDSEERGKIGRNASADASRHSWDRIAGYALQSAFSSHALEQLFRTA